jgi:hypothetical protein
VASKIPARLLSVPDAHLSGTGSERLWLLLDGRPMMPFHLNVEAANSCPTQFLRTPAIGKAVTLVMLHPPTPAREPTTWTHVPSQPLMRSLLSQFQAPTVTSQRRRFFRVWRFNRSPRRTHHPAYFRPATFTFASPFLPSTCVILLQDEKLSTPKVGANAISFRVRIVLPK